MRFTADAEFLALLEEVRGLSAHRAPSGDLLTLLWAGLQARRTELLNERFAVGRKPRARSTAKPNAATARDAGKAPESAPESRPAIPAAVAREVYESDGGRCTVVSPGGRRCSAHRKLELDHIEPWAVTHDDSAANLRLRCQTHNQLAARRYFGKGYMRSVLRRAGVRART